MRQKITLEVITQGTEIFILGLNGLIGIPPGELHNYIMGEMKVVPQPENILQDIQANADAKPIKKITKLSKLGFSVRTLNLLNANGIYDIEGLVRQNPEKIAKQRGVGKAVLREINLKLAELGLAMGLDL